IVDHMLTPPRPLTAGDFPSYTALLEEVDSLHREALPYVFRRAPGGSPRTQGDFERWLSDEAFFLRGVDVEGTLAGLVHAGLRTAADRPTAVPRTYVMVENLVVGQRHRRSGVATSLLRAVEAWAQAKAVNEVQLWVWEFNEDAQAFYRTLGYETTLRRM